MTLLEVANLPLTPATESWSTGSSIKQILLFAIVCVCINILMGYLPSSLPRLSDLKPVIQGPPMLRHHTSPPDNLLTTPVARVLAVVEKLVMEWTRYSDPLIMRSPLSAILLVIPSDCFILATFSCFIDTYHNYHCNTGNLICMQIASGTPLHTQVPFMSHHGSVTC